MALILTKVFDHVWHNKYLSPSQKVAIIILLYKKGDAKLLTNYRPISLTNADYKILVYVLMVQLTSHLTDVIAVNQTAYMKGCFIGMNICSVQDTMDHIAKKSWTSLVLFLDFRKAFDSVSHLFLFILLEHIGFPDEFLHWVRIMYTDISSMVQYKN